MMNNRSATTTLAISSNGQGEYSKRRRNLQVLSLSAFLILWVANSELLQGITSKDDKLFFPSEEAYDKPAFITWYSYNYMILSLLLAVYPYVKFREWTLSHYIRYIWSGKLGLARAVIGCTIISYTLQVLNILLIVGLECITVSLSNAVYQLQTVFTVGLSVCLLQDPFGPSDAIGSLVSVLGVALIVLPPLYYLEDKIEQQQQESSSSQPTSTTTCSWKSAPMLAGILATLGSAAIGGAYLVSWRVFDEKRNSTPPGRLGGLVDTQMTVAMIGLCNLFLGWPMLVLAHWLDFETFRWPSASLSSQQHHIWWMLNVNGFVEYLFDASCAVAIHMTSPVVVAIASPLTIPLSLVADKMLNGSTGGVNNYGILPWMGAALIVFGVYLLETKPKTFGWNKKKNHVEKLLGEDKEVNMVLAL
jgi:drug/metabolite transporter (DMT)-like permease